VTLAAAEAPLLRLGVRGPAGVVDVAAGAGTTPGELLGDDLRARLEVDPDVELVLVRRAGDPLQADQPLALQGVDDGDVLVVLVLRPGPGTEGGGPSAAVGTGRPGAARRSGLLAGAVASLLGACLVAVGAGGWSRPGTAGVAVLLALLALVAPTGRWGDACRLVAPVLVAVGTAVLLLGSDRPGQRALALTAAATAAAALAAVLRALRAGAPEALLLELVVACVLAVAAGGALLSGVSLPTLAALLTALAVCLVRVLPAMVIDVPDEELLDLDRVAVTAWSAQLPGQRRRKRVRTAEVTGQVGVSRRLLDAAVVAVVLTADVGVPVVLAQGGSVLPRTGAIALGCCAAVALPLHARAVRGALARTALLLGGTAAAAATLAALIFSADDQQRVVLGLGAAAAGACTVVAAVAVGRGWRSVRWARLADATEGLAVALALPAAVLASNGVEHVRSLVS